MPKHIPDANAIIFRQIGPLANGTQFAGDYAVGRIDAAGRLDVYNHIATATSGSIATGARVTVPATGASTQDAIRAALAAAALAQEGMDAAAGDVVVWPGQMPGA